MSIEKIIEEEIDRFGEWIEMLPDHQLAAFMVPILANRCLRAEMMVDYQKKRLEKIDNRADHGKD